MHPKNDLTIRASIASIPAAFYLKRTLSTNRKVIIKLAFDQHSSHIHKILVFLGNLALESNFLYGQISKFCSARFDSRLALSPSDFDSLDNLSLLYLGCTADIKTSLKQRTGFVFCGEIDEGIIVPLTHLFTFAKSRPNVFLYSALAKNSVFVTSCRSVSYVNSTNYFKNIVSYNAHLLRQMTFDFEINPVNVCLSDRGQKYLTLLKFMLLFVARKFFLFFRLRINKAKKVWSIAFLDLSPSRGKDSAWILIPNPEGKSFADPFVFEYKGKSAVFVEEIDLTSGIGSISVIDLDSKDYSKSIKIIDEQFHMSFPFLFEYNNGLYMCPETSNANQIRIYKCLDFPFSWEFHSVLMDNVFAKDPLLLLFGETWSLTFTTSKLGKEFASNELYMFSASSPFSNNWQACKSNPIELDTLKSRNAGYMTVGDKKYVFRQLHDTDNYGTGLTCYKAIPEKSCIAFDFISHFSLEYKGKKLHSHHISASNNYIFVDFKTPINQSLDPEYLNLLPANFAEQ